MEALLARQQHVQSTSGAAATPFVDFWFGVGTFGLTAATALLV